MKFSKERDSKFRFVIIASKRARQLLDGAKPKVKSKSRNLIRIAQEEIEQGVIGFDIVKSKKEELHDVEDKVFIGEELEDEEEEEEKSEDDLADKDEEKKLDNPIFQTNFCILI